MSGSGRRGRSFSSGFFRVLPRAALRRVSLLFLVALTGIEPATLQFSSVQLGLSSCVFGPVQLATKRLGPYRWLTCCPGAAARPGFGCSRGQSNTRPRLPRKSVARAIQPPRSARDPGTAGEAVGAGGLHVASDIRG